MGGNGLTNQNPPLAILHPPHPLSHAIDMAFGDWSSESIFFNGFLGAPAVIRATLEQIPLWEILLLEEILG
jgi:hypothetical protein